MILGMTIFTWVHVELFALVLFVLLTAFAALRFRDEQPRTA